MRFKEDVTMKHTFISSCALVLALTILGSCSGGNDETVTGETQTSPMEETTAETEKAIEGVPDTLDFEEAALRVMIPEGIIGYDDDFILADAYTGDLLDDVMYSIYIKTEEYLNIDVQLTTVPGLDVVSEMRSIILAGDDAFELMRYNVSWSNAASLIAAGGLYNILDMPYVKPFSEYYISEVNEMMVVNDQLYFVISAWPTVRIPTYMVFNKKMMDSLDMEYPYQYALDGKWTYDVFLDYIKGITSDLDGDGDFDIHDRYGYANMGNLTNLMAYGMGIEPFNQHEGGYYAPDFLNEKLINVFSKIIDLRERDDIFKANLYQPGSGSGHAIVDDAGLHVFMLGNSLFSTTGTGSLKLRYIEDFDFGIVPYPKYDESQEYYCGSQSPSPFAVPNAVGDPEMVGAALETLSQMCHAELAPTYINVYVNEKELRDEESVSVMQMIMNNRIMPEMAYYYQYDTNALLLESMNKIDSSGEIVSFLTKVQTKAEKRAQKFFEDNFQ